MWRSFFVRWFDLSGIPVYAMDMRGYPSGLVMFVDHLLGRSIAFFFAEPLLRLRWAKEFKEERPGQCRLCMSDGKPRCDSGGGCAWWRQ
jgi:hypothetical protein